MNSLEQLPINIKKLYKTLQLHLFYTTSDELINTIFDKLLSNYSSNNKNYKQYALLCCLKSIICKDINLLFTSEIFVKSKLINDKMAELTKQLQLSLITIKETVESNEKENIINIIQTLTDEFQAKDAKVKKILNDMTRYPYKKMFELPTNLDDFNETDDLIEKLIISDITRIIISEINEDYENEDYEN